MIAFRRAFSFQFKIMKDFRELKVWQSSCFPREELYGLASRLLRACSSIPPTSLRDAEETAVPNFARYCSIAMGSANELEYHLLLARSGANKM